MAFVARLELGWYESWRVVLTQAPPSPQLSPLKPWLYNWGAIEALKWMLTVSNAFPRTKIGRDHQVRDGFRNGMVIERKFDKERGPLVRVQYMDRQGLISYWLPVKQFGSRKTAHVYTPKIGDHVNVNMLRERLRKRLRGWFLFQQEEPAAGSGHRYPAFRYRRRDGD